MSGMVLPSAMKRETTKDTNLLSDKEYLICKKEEQILNPNSKLYKQISYHHRFRKRTFKTKDTKFIEVEEVKLKLQEECRNCKG